MHIKEHHSFSKVSVDQAFAPGLEGASYKVISNKKELLVYPSVTKHGRDFVQIEIGDINFKKKQSYKFKLVMADGCREINNFKLGSSDLVREFSIRGVELQYKE